MNLWLVKSCFLLNIVGVSVPNQMEIILLSHLISLIPLHAGITIACLIVTVTIAVLLVILVYKKERKVSFVNNV